MFLKLLVYRPAGLSTRLVITSFKKDNRYELKVCMDCGEETAHERVVPLAVTHAGKSQNIEDRQTYCGECKNISYVGEEVSQHELAVAAAIRMMDGLLSAEELRLVRARYRLKQTGLEKMLDTGPKTWTRWERGKVPQSKTADKLIRVIAEDPELHGVLCLKLESKMRRRKRYLRALMKTRSFLLE